MSKNKKLELAAREAYRIVKTQVMKAAMGRDPEKDRVAIVARQLEHLAEEHGFTVKQIEAEAQRLTS